MSASSWDLPGPSGFLDEALGIVRAGACLVLHSPPHFPALHTEAFRKGIREEGLLQFRELEDGSDPPLVLVARALDRDPAERDLASPEALARSRLLDTCLIWRARVPTSGWSVWGDFLARFARACREFPAGSCGQFCVTVDSEALVGRVCDDPGLRSLAWRRRVDRVDSSVHLAQVRDLPSSSPLEPVSIPRRLSKPCGGLRRRARARDFAG